MLLEKKDNTMEKTGTTTKGDSITTAISKNRSFLKRIWPIPPVVVATTLFPYVVASSLLINRGYTIWFYWNSFFFLLTQNEFQCKFLALQGLSVTVAWYACMICDWYRQSGGDFARILYWNMPSILTQHMINSDNQEIVYDTINAKICIFISHVLDIVGHPILAYYYWRRLWRNNNATTNTTATATINTNDEHEDGNASAGNTTTNNEILTWPVIISTYALSRTWSMVNNWYNYGKAGLFYFGYDVYQILDKEVWVVGIWLPAYIMEGITYILIIIYKLTGTGAAKKESSSASCPAVSSSSSSTHMKSPSKTTRREKPRPLISSYKY